jgi:hypothetical protein
MDLPNGLISGRCPGCGRRLRTLGGAGRAGTQFIVWGVLAMCLCLFVGPLWWVVLLVGAAIAVVGGVRLGGRSLGVALLFVGVVSGFYSWFVWFAVHQQDAGLNALGWVLMVGLALVAAIGVAGGLMIMIRPELIRPGRWRRSMRG